ncbi:LacI family transcriptional regulator [Bifidobacterium amazonense]|uniref:LacI family transcriptional regulator n=1 Tax=Bifidobacterium amazonense TaxID=2809027 RepID=A0ABS9VV75_9BIFI|nr:LacI family DNA-binding transcriptional regulator [Bifidobacterium amazonense]MCH9275997.1 LacI family transcriptional regulator [Bifidobacterium amazonense]
MVTLKDVAERAGVSPATVSYVLRGGRHVSKWTDERVRKAANELGYATNMAARSLKYGRTGVIELVVRGLDVSSIYAKMVTHVKHACSDRGYRSLVMQTEQDSRTLRDAVGEINSQSCDGMLLDAFGLPKDVIDRLNGNRAIVLLDDLSKRPAFDTVVMPHRESSLIATRYLIERGCRRIAFVGADRSDLQVAAGSGEDSARSLRLEGYLQAMEEAGLAVRPEWLIPVDWRYFVGVDVGRGLACDGRLDVDGVVCCNDSLAIGLIRGLADAGARVPDDVMVVGSDGVTVGEFTVPRLSTVALDVPDLVNKGLGMLIERIDGTYDGEPRRVTAGCSLVAKESAGESASAD